MLSDCRFHSTSFLNAAPSSSPHSVTVTSLSPYRLSITWQPPPVDTQNGVILHYIVRMLEDETVTEKLVNTSDNSTQLLLDDLHPFTCTL